jgi:NADPH:quinone reductase-like Zn-dependent oxidoreductase
MVKNLGANKAIDYRKEDFTQNGESYDIIYDAVGKSSYAKCQASLTEKGIYLSPVLSMKLLFRMIWTAMFDGKKAKFSATGARPIPELKPLLKEIKTLMKKGQLKSVIDQCFSMEQIVAAHQYIDTGHKKGNIVLLPDG